MMTKYEKMLKNLPYRFGFDAWGLALFLIVMVPNMLWFALPAPNDVLRTESVTPIVDVISMGFQVLMVAALCCLVRKDAQPMRLSPLIWATVACVVLYFAGWLSYYFGIANPLVIILLTIPPCLAFVCYACDQKKLPAILFATGFTICHLLFGVINFIVR